MTSGTRRLKSQTIISSDLYVERDADRQLDRIIDDMGRPGYVLVARQMGKTNLLIHMKQARERRNDLVVYLDLSVRFRSVKALFRHIIDRVVDSREELFQLRSHIITERTDANLEPNVEYDRHLRLILRVCSQSRLVIILDEVDALGAVTYADMFWSQIRSMYFVRVSYSEYEKLTYVLSGVAEPSELIRDRTISPFNIGEKIYLNDFTVDELRLFVSQACIELSDEMIGSIYEWGGGNPRVSWDICSELEQIMIIEGRVAANGDIKRVVDKLYLTSFDRAPIDHIRALVETDPSIRDAIIPIRYGKGETLDSKTLSRLYLAGIIGSLIDKPPQLKNRIIDLALSDQWLEQLSIDDRSLLERARDSYVAQQFQEVVTFVETYCRQRGPSFNLTLEYKIMLGISHFQVGQHETAIEELTPLLESISDTAAAQRVRYYVGSATLLAGRPDESLSIFEAVVEVDGPVRKLGYVAMSAALAAVSAKDNLQRILEISKILIDNEASPLPGVEEQNEILATAHYNCYVALLSGGMIDSAADRLKQAERFAPTSFKPTILLAQINLSSNAIERHDLARRAMRIIVDCKLDAVDGPIRGLEFSARALANVLIRVVQSNDSDVLSELLGDIGKRIYPARTMFESLVALASVRDSAEDSARAVLFELAFERFGETPLKDEDVLIAARSWLLISPAEVRAVPLARYLAEFRARSQAEYITSDDVGILYDHLYRLNAAKQSREALWIIDCIEKFHEAMLRCEPVYFFILLHQEFLIYRGLNDLLSSRRIAEEIVTRSPASQTAANGLGKPIMEFFDLIVKSAVQFLGSVSTQNPYRRFGRNDKVRVQATDGSGVFEAKFKHVEGGLRKGELVLIENLGPRRRDNT